MAYVELGMRIEASADRVWAFLTGPELGELITRVYAEKVEFTETEKGLVATTTLKDGGGVIRERIVSQDNEEKCMKYEVLDYGPLPYAHYQGETRVMPSGANSCHLSLQSSFVPVGIPAEECKRFWLEHNTEFFGKLNEALATE